MDKLSGKDFNRNASPKGGRDYPWHTNLTIYFIIVFSRILCYIIFIYIRKRKKRDKMKPVIPKENVKPLFDSKFLRVFDLQYEKDRHYFDATRRPLDNIVATKTVEDFKTMLPDAVTCVVILKIKGDEPKLLLTREYRYPTGQFLLSPPAGLLDSDDAQKSNPVLSAAKREILEETGIDLGSTDSLFVINPLLFSSPGMTDESNALACAVINLEDTSSLSQDGAVGSECFDGFMLISADEAKEILKTGTDPEGIFYSVYTWSALMYFISDLWR